MEAEPKGPSVQSGFFPTPTPLPSSLLEKNNLIWGFHMSQALMLKCPVRPGHSLASQSPGQKQLNLSLFRSVLKRHPC